MQANLRQPRVRQLVEAHVLDLGQPRLALLKGAGDVTTHGSPLGKWLLGLSDVVVHGETGPLEQMQPTCNFDQRQPCPECWSIETFGNFIVGSSEPGAPSPRAAVGFAFACISWPASPAATGVSKRLHPASRLNGRRRRV